MPSLIVSFLGKMLFHKSAIRTLGPLSATTLVQRDNTFCYAKLFTAETVVVLAVISGIGKHSPETDTLVCLPHSGGKFRRIITGAATYNTTGKQIGIGMTDQSYFGPAIA